MSQQELIAIKDAIDGIYKNEIYDNEYTHFESKYIIKEPMIHLDVDKILEDLKNNCCEIKYITNKELSKSSNFTYIYGRNHGGYSHSIKINFPVNIKLNDNEYIIKLYFICNNVDMYGEHIKRNVGVPFDYQQPFIDSGSYEYTYNIIYMTNYSRMIKSNDVKFFKNNYQNRIQGYNGFISNKFPIISIEHGELKKIDCEFYRHVTSKTLYDNIENCELGLHLYDKSNNYPLPLIDSPKLFYRIPRLFIDVIDAFHTQNTDLMQESCKKYLEISRESKVKESIMKDIQVRNIEKEKDKIIADKDKIIEDKDKEIINLKDQLKELQQKYNKIKKMFD